jgi:RNA polymerase subunit RPABC4/transcription elongation factor Spt4
MSQTGQDSAFKYVFWGILFLMLVAFLGQVAWLFLGGARFIPHLLGFGEGVSVWGPHMFAPRVFVTSAPMLLLTMIYIAAVAGLVYRDAKSRGLDPWLWATVATFVPFFLGVIVYLIVRSNGKAVCESCGRPIRSDYKICPYCGHRRESACPQCERPVAADWKICPYCEKKLTADT